MLKCKCPKLFHSPKHAEQCIIRLQMNKKQKLASEKQMPEGECVLTVVDTGHWGSMEEAGLPQNLEPSPNSNRAWGTTGGFLSQEPHKANNIHLIFTQKLEKLYDLTIITSQVQSVT